jgi:hypothetical protein
MRRRQTPWNASRWSAVLAAGLLAALFAASASQPEPGAHSAPASQRPRTLAFRIDEGRNLNSFLRAGPVAAHLLLRSGHEPRILVAFPAGNSGVGLWFEKTAAPVEWTLIGPPRAISSQDGRGRPLHGIEFDVGSSVPELRPRASVLSSVRVLRDHELSGKAPDSVRVAPRVDRSGVISWTRDRLDGEAGYQLVIEAQGGARVTTQRFLAAEPGRLRLRIRALTGETPLVPLDSVVTSRAGRDTRSRQVLDFLSYEDKFLAGSWRFNTYFGRDTLISALLLAAVLEPVAMESAIASVLDRLDPKGEVAHEEDIGEFAVLRNAREGRGRVATPVYDYGMVDDDFLLAPLAARWLLDDERGSARARTLLSSKGTLGERRGSALVRNLVWITQRTSAFANEPRAANLVGIKPGRMTGNWRDSEQGLGGGRFAYDINAALVPAALAATARLFEAGVLDEYLDPAQRAALAEARPRARIWAAQAATLFAVEIPAAQARHKIAAYAREIGVDDGPALRMLGEKPMRFHALSLDDGGKPVPIVHSDEGFRLLLTEPSPEELATCLAAIMHPFPAGLLTEVGLLVANPALAAPELRSEFTRFAYHGTVVWSWQQALLAAGLERQLRRVDLSAATRAQLLSARARLWSVIDKSRALHTSELWSWSYSPDQDRYRMEPFGRGADADESNAAQLWSTVYLGLGSPTTDTLPGN